MQKRTPFSYQFRAVGVTSAVVTARGRKPGPRETDYCTIVNVENEISAASDARIGVERAGLFFTFAYLLNLAIDTPQSWATAPIVVRGDLDEILRVDIEGSTDGDGLLVNVHGYTQVESG